MKISTWLLILFLRYNGPKIHTERRNNNNNNDEEKNKIRTNSIGDMPLYGISPNNFSFLLPQFDATCLIYAKHQCAFEPRCTGTPPHKLPSWNGPAQVKGQHHQVGREAMVPACEWDWHGRHHWDRGVGTVQCNRRDHNLTTQIHSECTLTCSGLVLCMLGLGSMGNVYYSKLELLSVGWFFIEKHLALPMK